MNPKVLTCLAFLAVASAARAGATNDWENPAVNSLCRLPPRTYSLPLATEADALSDAIDPETPYRLSLNGLWRYSWTGDPKLRVRDFARTDFDDSAWFTIDVPSCVEMRGFGSPGYTNQRFPHKDCSHPTNSEFATIRDRQSGKADYNPVSQYRRTFSVPAGWKGRRVILRFDGVYSAYYVWVNGRKVGYAEDSMLPSEFDITPYLNDTTRTNLLCVEVYRWCDGSYFEDQDMTRFSGIFRDVTLWSMPADGIWDFVVRTRPVGGYGKWDLELELEGDAKAGEKASAALYDAVGKKVGDLQPHSGPALRLRLDPRLWSAEDPYLYTLVIRKGDDIRRKKVGFKEQKIVGNAILVNGKKIKFRGVNRHETNPENGRTVSLADMIRDVTLMKRYNIDTVRTSHYPDHHLWYDLCDRYGLYLCAEADVEGHEPQYGENGLGRFPEWDHTVVERNERHVRFYRNHPSVTLWSMGNETGHGDCFRHAIAAVKAIDPSRPVHWERGNPDADVDSSMYRDVGWMERRGQLGDKPRGTAFMERDNPWCADCWQTSGKPFFLCEYAHAMGNAVGNLEEYWETFYRYDALSGGCIWDWVDQAVWKATGHVGADGKAERFLAYGGDFDEQPNDGPFNCNGIVGPEREVTAKLIEVGHVYRNLAVTRQTNSAASAAGDLRFELWNRFAFTRADAFDGRWDLIADGVPVAGGAFAVPPVAPLARAAFALPELASVPRDPAKEHFVNFTFTLKNGTLWAERGWPVARNQVALGEKAKGGAEGGLRTASPSVAASDKTVTVMCGGTKAVFCRKSGTLCSLEMNGVGVLKDPAPGVVTGPRLTCARAFVDNDNWIRGYRNPDVPGQDTFLPSGLTQLRYHARPIRVENGRVVTVTEVTGSKSAGFTHTAEWTFAADGSISVRNTVEPHGTMPAALPRLGLSLVLDTALERVRYYGRGPRENYIDRCTGSFVGLYDTTVSEMGENYVRPQDNGYRSDVRRVEFRDAAGRGVRFSASRPLFVQALRQTQEDLECARPRRGQPRFRTPLAARPEIYLNLDVRQLGLGGNSCGPGPMSKYVFPVGREEWTVKIEAAGR